MKFRKFVDRYKNLKLDIGYYREFNQESVYRLIDSEFTYTDDTFIPYDNKLEHLDIDYNFFNYVVAISKILIWKKDSLYMKIFILYQLVIGGIIVALIAISIFAMMIKDRKFRKTEKELKEDDTSDTDWCIFSNSRDSYFVRFNR